MDNLIMYEVLKVKEGCYLHGAQLNDCSILLKDNPECVTSIYAVRRDVKKLLEEANKRAEDLLKKRLDDPETFNQIVEAEVYIREYLAGVRCYDCSEPMAYYSGLQTLPKPHDMMYKMLYKMNEFLKHKNELTDKLSAEELEDLYNMIQKTLKLNYVEFNSKKPIKSLANLLNQNCPLYSNTPYKTSPNTLDRLASIVQVREDTKEEKEFVEHLLDLPYGV